MDFAYFGLKFLPFSKELDTGDFFQSYDLKESLGRLNYIKQHRGIFLLTGEPGGGKTSVLRTFVDQLNPQSHECHYTPHATVSKSEIYRQLNGLLRLTPAMSKSKLYSQIQEAIWDKYRHQGVTPCVILDEAHLMGIDTLQELILLANFKMDSKVPFILILTGQPMLKDLLRRRALEALNQRIGLRYHIGGLNLDECRPYIEHHLKLAGRTEQLFDDSCYEMIHQIAQGLPRKIGNICTDAMTYVQMKGLRKIDSEIIHIAGNGL